VVNSKSNELKINSRYINFILSIVGIFGFGLFVFAIGAIGVKYCNMDLITVDTGKRFFKV
jgi:hypothetical protein